jgi:hypothetical protein
MKNLANCTPSEFLVQSNKIRKSVQKWLKLTDIMNIRTKKPKLEPFTNDMSEEDKEAAKERNRVALREQAQENLSEMLDKMLEEYPNQTLEVIALCNFIEPSEIDNYKMPELMANVTEMISDEAVVDFFGLLMRLADRNTSTSAKR